MVITTKQGGVRVLFWHILKKYISEYKAITILLVLGIIVCVYSISVMLGIAVGQYRLATSSNTYATVTVDVGTNTAADVERFSEYIEMISDGEIVNELFFTGLSDGDILIGWSGQEAQNWFPVMSGDFFTEEEQEKGADMAFVSSSIKDKIGEKDSVSVGNREYLIKGVGWIIPWSFQVAISASSQTRVIREDATEFDTDFIILPFNRYKREFKPQQVLIQFKNASYSDLQEYVTTLEQKFTDCSVYMPDINSDEVLCENQKRYGLIAVILCVIAGVTVVRLMSEWISLYKKEVYVLWLCGMSRIKCLLMIYGHWALYYVWGSLIAVMLHYASFPVLKHIYGDSLPVYSTILIILSLMFILTIICTVGSMKKIMNSTMKENVA